MLTQIEIKNYRSCRHVVLKDLGPFTVLVGRNAAGKSNILRGIHWLAANATVEPRFVSQANATTRVSCQVVLGNEIYRYSLERHVNVAEPPPRSEVSRSESLRHATAGARETPVFSRDGEEVRISNGRRKTSISIGRYAPCMPALISLLPADSATTKVIRAFLHYLERIRYYDSGREAAVADSMLINRATYDEWLARHDTNPGDSPLMRLLHMALANAEQFAEVRSLLGPHGLGLLDQIEWGKFKIGLKPTQREKILDQWYRIVFAPTSRSRHGPQFLDFNDLAAGTQRIVRIVVSLIHDQSAVMLLEHPEDGIHRGLLRKLIDLLQKYSDQSQLIIASHSTVVFNSLDPRAIRLVTMGEDGASVRSLTERELRAAETFLEDEGTLSDFIESVEEG
jgi:predicted ATPase